MSVSSTEPMTSRSSRMGDPTRTGAGSPPQQGSAISQSSAKLRTSHACYRCRFMRTKCSGGQTCTKCSKDGATCAYSDRKRERNKKDLAESVEVISILRDERDRLLNILRNVASSPNLLPEERREIADVLQTVSSDQRLSENDEILVQSSSGRSLSANQEIASLSHADGFERPAHYTVEASATSTVGSPARVGELAQIVDLDKGTGVSGIVGKMSEITWIQRASEYLSDQIRAALDDLHPEIDNYSVPAKDFSYYMDEANILAVDEDHVDAQAWPRFDVAILLAEAYFHACQGAFEFIAREEFLNTLVKFQRHKTVLSWSERRWLSLANMVWALGSKWLQFANLASNEFCGHHLVYYARARALGLDHRVMLDHPGIDGVQSLGILAFYLATNGSISRAYNALGHANRHATALGLHLTVSDPTISVTERARRATTWFSLYSLEIFTAEVTGRPTSISNSHVTISVSATEQRQEPLVQPTVQLEDQEAPIETRSIWLNFLNERRESSQMMTGGTMPWRSFAMVGQGMPLSHFPHRVRLCQMSNKIAEQLYSGNSDTVWSEVQRKIGELQTELRHWLEQLPPELALHSSAPTNMDPRAKIELNMYYYSVQMILYRPCLRDLRAEKETTRAHEFNQSCARACVHAAMSMVANMPDNPTLHEAYQLLPWWTLLHYVAQVASVLLLELCLHSQHFPSESNEVVNYLKKAMAYLWCMTEGSLSAYRAWRIFRGLLSQVSMQQTELNMADIPVHAPQPQGWMEEDEVGIQNIFTNINIQTGKTPTDWMFDSTHQLRQEN